jgi:hemolysin activation/secretion protein
VPPQEIVDGTIPMLVLEGYLDEDGIKIDDRANGSTSIDYVRRILSRYVKTGEPIRRGDYERALLIVESLPGVHLRSRLYPGTKAGTARLGVEIYQTSVARGGVSYDNFGFYGIGRNRVTAQGSFENAVHHNEALSLVASTTGRNQKFAGVEASVPLGNDGLVLSAIGNFLDYRLRKEYDTANQHGWGAIAGLHVSYPLQLLRDQKVYVSGRAERSLSSDKSDGVADFERNVDVMEVSLHGDLSSSSAVTAFAVTGFAGYVDVTNGADFFGTEGSFTVLEVHANRLQRLYGNFSGFLSGKAQVASRNLDGLFKCSVGGPSSNRGFPVGEASADQCLILNSDIRYDFEKRLLGASWQLAAFFDYGLTRQDKNSVGGVTNFSDNLASVGVATRARLGASGFLRASVGYQLTDSDEKRATGNHSDFNSASVRFWVQAGFQF